MAEESPEMSDPGAAPRIAVVNGPSLNLLGTRETAIYGDLDLKGIEDRIRERAVERGAEVEFFQSNHEGAIIDYLHGAQGRITGLVLNPAGLTHTSVALRDALLAVGIPFVEVHISNIFAREPFRAKSLTADIAVGVVTGLGWAGYLHALDALLAVGTG